MKKYNYLFIITYIKCRVFVLDRISKMGNTVWYTTYINIIYVSHEEYVFKFVSETSAPIKKQNDKDIPWIDPSRLLRNTTCLP